MKKTKLALAIATAGLFSSQAFATNGMNMEGYGPVSTAMGGTASAYNNGLGGMMNNPSTMGMGAIEGNKIQVALGNLRPNVSSSMDGMPDADSSGDSYLMPGFGFAMKRDRFTYGIGVLGQGGMGTEYGADSFLAMGTGEEVRSEVGVGRVVLPLNYDVTDKFNVGASIDYVWAGMDLKMAAQASDLQNMVADGTTMPVNTLMGNFLTMTGGTQITAARFDFSNNDDFTGEATGTGFGGKLGFTYKASDMVTLGASYHTKTNLSDLTTSNATMTMYDDTGASMPVSGKIKVKDFQWPATFAMGLSVKPNDKWMINADIKHIGWKDVMKSFKMDFITESYGTLAVEMPQNWKDQTVFMMGAQYKATDALAVRAGVNLSSNPVPDSTLNPLFPATIENHITGGFGYDFNDNSTVDFSLAYAPEVKATNPYTTITTTHSQLSWQAMYTYKWGIVKK